MKCHSTKWNGQRLLKAYQVLRMVGQYAIEQVSNLVSTGQSTGRYQAAKCNYVLKLIFSSSSNRLLRTCLLVSVTFLVCWFPFACLNPLMSYYPKWFGAPYGWVLHEVSIWLGKATCSNGRHRNQFSTFVLFFSIHSILGWMNSAFNPVIYYYVVKAKATKR